MTTFTLHFVGIVLTVATLPLVLELALLTGASFWPRRKFWPSLPPSPIRLGVLVPAHNEALLIERCVKSLRASAAGTETEIIVVAHNCSDQTAHFATEAGARVETYDAPDATGKGFALLHGFELMLSHGMDAILVIDADSEVSPNLIDVVRGGLATGVEIVQCRYEMNSSSKRPMTRLTALAFRGRASRLCLNGSS